MPGTIKSMENSEKTERYSMNILFKSEVKDYLSKEHTFSFLMFVPKFHERIRFQRKKRLAVVHPAKTIFKEQEDKYNVY